MKRKGSQDMLLVILLQQKVLGMLLDSEVTDRHAEPQIAGVEGSSCVLRYEEPATSTAAAMRF